MLFLQSQATVAGRIKVPKPGLLIIFLGLVSGWFSSVASAQTATLTAASSTYSAAGGNLTLTATVVYPAEANALSFAVFLPAGWRFVSQNMPADAGQKSFTESPTATKPYANLEWAFGPLPAGQLSWSFVVSYPSGLTGNQVISIDAANSAYRPGPVFLSIPDVTLTLANQAPSITTPPANAGVTAGANASFSVVAAGSPAPTYKWQRSTDGGASYADLSASSTYSGVATATLAIAGVSQAMVGYKFRAVASNGVGADAISSAATLSVNVAPAISVQPKSQAVSTGANLVLSVGASGSPEPSYQWKKAGANLSDGGRIAGATTATLTITAVQSGDEGSYTVVVNNGIDPSATSSAASVTLVAAGFAATHALVGGGYTPGGSVTVTNTITYPGELASLSWEVVLPAGWSFASAVNAGSPFVEPKAADIELLEWAWVTIPVSGSSFTYTVNVPAGASGTQNLAALVGYGVGVDELLMVAKPDPLPASQILFHTADTNRNYKIDLSELTRVITLYNTRFDTPAGKQRTGCYKILAGSVDGFSTDTARDPTAVVTLTSYHAADYNRNGKIDLSELTRVITLYNTRYDTGAGKQRTGYYKVATGLTTVDGYTTDSSRAP